MPSVSTLLNVSAGEHDAGEGLRICKYERNFLGSGWAFIETQEGKTFWLHQKTGKVLPSSRNWGKE